MAGLARAVLSIPVVTAWTPRQTQLALVAQTVPLLDTMSVVHRSDVQVVAAAWAAESARPLDAVAMAALLPAATAAMGGVMARAGTVTVSTDEQTVVVAELSADVLVVFGFREAVSFDWASYYVRRALRML